MKHGMRVRTGAAIAAFLLASACSPSFGFRKGATEQGRDIGDLWQVFIVAAVIVAGIVYALIGWSLLRYRRRRADDENALGRQFDANVPAEVVYTAIPVAIVIALFALTLRTNERVTEVVPDPDVVLNVDAFSWGWRFDYPELGVVIVSPPSGPGEPVAQIMLPADETTRVMLRSNDVIHAFWIPDFNFKRDAIPGHTNQFDLTPTDQGSFRGVCSEFCGLGHAYMTFEVTVTDRASFDRWVTQHQEVASSTATASPSTPPVAGAPA
jgi:cytochrome c oxidase subunit II